MKGTDRQKGTVTTSRSIRSQTTVASVVADVQTASLGPTPVILKDDGVMSGQPAKQPGEDSNRVGQQLGILRIRDGAFHGRGIDPNLASPLQSLALRPLDQAPVDLLPGGGLDVAGRRGQSPPLALKRQF